MRIQILVLIGVSLSISGCAPARPASKPAAASQPDAAATESPQPASSAQPLAIGDSFIVDSAILGEKRSINVFTPTVYGQKIDRPMSVLYMPDGGLDEDFLHIAGLVQVLVSDGSMRPFMLVGIPNTDRKRDLTGPTSNPEDRKLAPSSGGSAAFRRFMREELMPTIRARYRTADEAAIVGESLAGLFVVETFFLDQDLFSTYIAIDPSLWWDSGALVNAAEAYMTASPAIGKTLFLSHSNEPTIAKFTDQLAHTAAQHRASGFVPLYAPLPSETHATIYHPAAFLAFRSVFAPLPDAQK